MLTDYVIVFAQQGWDEDGDQTTPVGLFVRDDDLPFYRQIELVTYASARLNARLAD